MLIKNLKNIYYKELYPLILFFLMFSVKIVDDHIDENKYSKKTFSFFLFYFYLNSILLSRKKSYVRYIFPHCITSLIFTKALDDKVWIFPILFCIILYVKNFRQSNKYKQKKELKLIRNKILFSFMSEFLFDLFKITPIMKSLAGIIYSWYAYKTWNDTEIVFSALGYSIARCFVYI